MLPRWKLALAPLAVAATLVACAAPQEDQGGATDDAIVATITPTEREDVEKTDISSFKFDHLTETGSHLFKAMVYWRAHQLSFYTSTGIQYPFPKMCASNVSKALFLGGYENYNAEAVSVLIKSIDDDVKKGGAKIYALPRPIASSGDKQKFIDLLNSIDGGKLPTGIVLAGCHTSRCDAEPGEQHVGMIGNVDADGTVWAWHNNWYRPENEGGAWKPYMIYSENHDLYTKKGLRRQWMPTPWLKITRDTSGKITDAVHLLPAIDDMDPFNGKYTMVMAVIPELAKELSPSH